MKQHYAWQRPMRLRRTTGIAVLSTAVLVGLVCARSTMWTDAAIGVAAVALLAAAVRRSRPVLIAVLLAVFGLGLGISRGVTFRQQLRPYEQLYNRTVQMQVVANEDAVYGTNGQLSFDAVGIQFQTPLQQSAPGRVKVSGFGELMVYKGDVVSVGGKLRPTLGGRQGQISYATIKREHAGTGPVDSLRREFAAGMLSALPEPSASFGLGLLIGQRSTLPKDVSDQLSIVGLTHLVAVSGYNLTIIVQAMRRISGKRSKFQTLAGALLLISLFLLVTGLSASIVRAAIVSSLTLLAWYYGRNIKPLLLISLTAAITALVSPIYIWGDIGWYLSFLAFFGVLVLAPLITERIYRDRKVRFLQATIIETLSAQIMTLPLILYVFQQVSFIALASNVLVVPLVPIAMLASVVAGLGGMLAPSLAGWVAWPGQVLLTYMLDVAAALSKVPHAIEKASLPVAGLVACYVLIIGWWLLLRSTIRRKHGILTDTKQPSELVV